MKILFYLSLLLLFQCKPAVSESIATEEKGITYTDVDILAAKSMMSDNPSLIILDVRTPEETAEGKIENAIELDFKADNFKEGLEKLDKTAPYLVYCRSGKRSANASQMMTEVGFSNVHNLLGGYIKWTE